jgi:hypothetical protein
MAGNAVSNAQDHEQPCELRYQATGAWDFPLSRSEKVRRLFLMFEDQAVSDTHSISSLRSEIDGLKFKLSQTEALQSSPSPQVVRYRHSPAAAVEELGDFLGRMEAAAAAAEAEAAELELQAARRETPFKELAASPSKGAEAWTPLKTASSIKLSPSPKVSTTMSRASPSRIGALNTPARTLRSHLRRVPSGEVPQDQSPRSPNTSCRSSARNSLDFAHRGFDGCTGGRPAPTADAPPPSPEINVQMFVGRLHTRSSRSSLSSRHRHTMCGRSLSPGRIRLGLGLCLAPGQFQEGPILAIAPVLSSSRVRNSATGLRGIWTPRTAGGGGTSSRAPTPKPTQRQHTSSTRSLHQWRI